MIQVEGHTEAVFITCGSLTTCQVWANQNTSHTRKISLTEVKQAVVSAQAKWGRKRHWQQIAGRSPYEEQLEEVKGRRDPIDRGRWEGPRPTHFTAFPVPVAPSSERYNRTQI